MAETTFAFVPNFGQSSAFQTTSAGSQNRVAFGLDYAHADFVVPVMAFTFYDALGEPKELSNLYIRMTSSFETALANPFQETEGIFGSPGNMDTVLGALKTIGVSGLEALTKQLINASGALGGYLASAGQTGKAQIEFLRREMFNNFQQLIYKGPQFRRFSPSFTMRPTSLAEAKAMKEIISTFKIASSPKSASLFGSLEADASTSILGPVTQAQRDAELGELGINTETQSNGEQDAREIEDTSTTIDFSNILGDSKFTFGYPDMCSFEIMLLQGNDDITTVFRSKICVIENVAVTYGSQNKLTFFDDDGEGAYFPTDVTLQLQLKEAVLQTENDAQDEYENNSLTIL
jgi:hypothetical protein